MSTHSSVSDRRLALSCLALLAVTSAVIHFAVAGEHFQEYWLFGVFMLAAGWFQLLWAALAVTRPSRLLLWASAIVNVGIIVVYVVTRTVGDVVGPTPNAVEPVGFGDLLCTVLEAVVAAGSLWLLSTTAERRVDRRAVFGVPAVCGAAMAVLLSVALVDGGPEMVMGNVADAAATSPSMHMSGTEASSVRLATTSPAGDITMPDPHMQMAAGMQMANPQGCTTQPTSAQQHAAVELVNQSWQGASKFQSLAVAKAAGYRPITPPGQPVVHYLNPAAYRDTVRGGPILDTAAPQSLVYANTPRGAVLAAAMYITSPGGATPQPGGCLTQWHVHTNLCLRRNDGVVAVAGPGCPPGSENRVTPAMMHVWFVPIPGGPTAVDAPDAQVVHAAEQVPSPHNGTA